MEDAASGEVGASDKFGDTADASVIFKTEAWRHFLCVKE